MKKLSNNNNKNKNNNNNNKNLLGVHKEWSDCIKFPRKKKREGEGKEREKREGEGKEREKRKRDKINHKNNLNK